MGLLDKLGFGRLKEGLARTREGIVERVSRIVSTRRTIDEELLAELEEILIGADIGLETTGAIIDGVRRRAKEKGFTDSDQLNELLKEQMRALLAGADTQADPLALPPDRPAVIMVVGINGVGKTTTIGKLANLYVREGKKVVIAAADTFRAAANEQIEIWAERARAILVRQAQGSDPAAVAFDALASAVSQGADVVIVDTAGRLHTRVNLMEELAKIKRVIQKRMPDAPHEVLLVLDASTGQNGLQQAKQFDASVGITGLVLTKLDGTAKGGIVIAVTRAMQVPVRYVGVGEGIDDLQPFDATAFVAALFGEEGRGDA